METLKTPSEYSVDFNRGFQGFSMANLEKGKQSFKNSAWECSGSVVECLKIINCLLEK